MAIYRNIQMSFWTDSDVVDEYTPEDKLFYLYLLTNPHTNLCGCYEVSKAQLATEIGYDRKKIDKLIERAEREHRTIVYSRKTKEFLILNWNKYNWTASEKFRKPLLKEIEAVKDEEFKRFLMDLYNGTDTVSIPYAYGTDTTVTVTVTDTVSDTDKNINIDNTDTVNNKQFKKVNITYYPNDEKLDQAFRDYVEMRKSIKAPMTDRAITLAMNKLRELSKLPFSDIMDNDLAIKILEQSTMNSWKGLFPLKNEKGNVVDEWRNAL